MSAAFQQCINSACAATFDVGQVLVACPQCGSLLDVQYDWEKLPKIKGLSFFEHRWSTKGSGVEGRLDFRGFGGSASCCRFIGKKIRS